MNKPRSGRTSRTSTIAWSICRSDERRDRWFGSGSLAKEAWGVWWSSAAGPASYQGAVGYRVKPTKGLGRNVVTEAQLRQLLDDTGFRVVSAETIRDSSRSSNIPVRSDRKDV